MNLNSEIWVKAPETEPERQYYFIEVCKKPVSYTHLDVYKRQAPPTAR